MAEQGFTSTERTLFRALCRVRELPAEHREAVLDRGMEKWLEAFLQKHPDQRTEMEEGEAFTRFFAPVYSPEKLDSLVELVRRT